MRLKNVQVQQLHKGYSTLPTLEAQQKSVQHSCQGFDTLPLIPQNKFSTEHINTYVRPEQLNTVI